MYQPNNGSSAPKPKQLSDEVIRSLMLAVDIDTLHLTGQWILIFHEDANKQNDDTKTTGGIILTDKALEEARMDKITIGTIVSVGPQVNDKEIEPGKRALFFRANSEGAIKGMDDKIYVLFNEYNIRGILPAIS